jgi:GT2 family glycosyltransferase
MFDTNYRSHEASFSTKFQDFHKRPEVKGRYIYIGDEKLWIRGATYGTFKPDSKGNEFHDKALIKKDLKQMAVANVNVVRTYSPPPKWFLDTALLSNMFVMVGLPWEQHVTFLDSRKTIRSIKDRIKNYIKPIAGHPALLCYVIGNEIPSSIVRWHGRKKIEQFLKCLYMISKREDPDGLVTYVNYPTTEYLQLSFLDFLSFNVYLEEKDKFESYLSRLHNIAGDLPLVIGEIGLDSRRNGEKKQAEVLDWQVRTSFSSGCAGAFVFGWTDEWHRGGHDVDDWDFGLTDRNRAPKKALSSVQKAFSEVPFPPDTLWPKISVIVCTHNGSLFIRDCFDNLMKLDYPDFEVIVVNDGSTDDTEAIARQYDFRLINTGKRGLSNARNTGLEEATGTIVAFIDDDAYPEKDWLKYLAATFNANDCAGVGGPNISPPGDGNIADCIANAPGGPSHVLFSDKKAEHIPGCNMAFRKKCLEIIGGFDPQFVSAGDDVDICWRIQERGWWLAFSAASMVWHHRRNSISAYWRQQKGYGKAEALLERKWPEKYNTVGHINWSGKIYGNGDTKIVSGKKWYIYYGSCGSSPFQSLYEQRTTFLQSLILMPEWYIINFALMAILLLGFLWKPFFVALPILVVTMGLPLLNVMKSMYEASFTSNSLSGLDVLKLRLLTGFLHVIQPLARLYGRLRHGLTPWRWRGKQLYAFPSPRKFEIWRENWRPPNRQLQSVKTALASKGAIVRKGNDFDSWDLEIRGGLFGAVQSRMAVEEHGGGKQLVRFHTWAKVSPIGLSLIFLFSLLSVFAVIDQAILAAILLGVLATGIAIETFQNCAAATAICKQAILAQKALDNVDRADNELVSSKSRMSGGFVSDIKFRKTRDL